MAAVQALTLLESMSVGSPVPLSPETSVLCCFQPWVVYSLADVLQSILLLLEQAALMGRVLSRCYRFADFFHQCHRSIENIVIFGKTEEVLLAQLLTFLPCCVICIAPNFTDCKILHMESDTSESIFTYVPKSRRQMAGPHKNYLTLLCPNFGVQMDLWLSIHEIKYLTFI